MVVRVRVPEIRVHLNPDPTRNVSGFEKLHPESALLMHHVRVEPVPDNPGFSGSSLGRVRKNLSSLVLCEMMKVVYNLLYKL